MWYFIRKSKNLTISPKYLKIDKIMLKNVFTIGLPASLNEMLFSASNIILNRFAVGYGDDVIAAIGVVFKVNMFPVLILMGLCQGVQPLIGYNYASGDQKRLKGIMKFTGIFGGNYWLGLYRFTVLFRALCRGSLCAWTRNGDPVWHSVLKRSHDIRASDRLSIPVYIRLPIYGQGHPIYGVVPIPTRFYIHSYYYHCQCSNRSKWYCICAADR